MTAAPAPAAAARRRCGTGPASPVRLRRADPPLRLGRSPSTAWTSTSPAASSSPCSAPRAAARRRRCGRSPASTGPTTAGCCSTAGTSPTSRRTSGTWAWSSRPTASSRTSPSPTTSPSGCGCAAGARPSAARRAAELLELVGLADRGDRYPHQLSGGQQQRVALARALAVAPQVLLLDEPLSALDAQVRVQLREEIRRIQLELGITTVFVTHDQAEALSVADRVGVLRAGRLEQVASPDELYERPGDRLRRRVRRHDEPACPRRLRRRRGASCSAPAVRSPGAAPASGAVGRARPPRGAAGRRPTRAAPAGSSPARSPAPAPGSPSRCPTAPRCGSTSPSADQRATSRPGTAVTVRPAERPVLVVPAEPSP